MIPDSSFINSYLLNLRPYKTVVQEIWTRDAAEWDRILKLDWNEATVEPAPQVKEAILSFVASNNFFHLYPSTYNPELLSLLSQYAQVPEANVQFFASSDSLHEYIAKEYVSAGDKVLIMWPSYDNFRSTVEGSGARIVYSELDPGYRFNQEKFEEDILREQPKLVYLCNPNNPTGLLLELDEIEALLTNHPRTLFVIDEAYAEFAHQTANCMALTHGNILVTHTLSKAFALANIRFGYLVSSVDNIDAISRIRNPKNIPTLTQIAAVQALRNVEYMWEYVREVDEARAWFIDAIDRAGISRWLKVYPSSANFVLMECRDITTRSAICYSLRKKDIYVRQLNQSSSLLSCFRVTVGKREQMQRVFDQICQVLSEIRARQKHPISIIQEGRQGNG